MLASRALISLSFFRDSTISFLYSAGKTLASIVGGSVEQAPSATIRSNNHDRGPTILMIMSSPAPATSSVLFSISAHVAARVRVVAPPGAEPQLHQYV